MPETTTYSDQSVYQLLLAIAMHDVKVTQLEFDQFDVVSAVITANDCRAAVSPSEDGTELEWELYGFPRRGRWREVGSGAGDSAATRSAVIGHLRGASDYAAA